MPQPAAFLRLSAALGVRLIAQPPFLGSLSLSLKSLLLRLNFATLKRSRDNPYWRR
jgi:hypothetical protein